MKIHGLQKMTLLDYPGKVACTVFLGGCDMRCPFCHNSELTDGSAESVMTEEELRAFRQRSKPGSRCRAVLERILARKEASPC